MRRISLWFLSTVSAVVLLFGYHTSTSGALAAQTAVVSSPVTTDSASSTTTSGGASGSGGSGGSTDATATTTVTGDVVQTQWGPVQVQIVVDSGTITQVSVLQYPSGNREDAQINGYALPILVDETVQAQSAEIDMVSGATVTSVGYLQSLQSALDQAGL